MIFLHLGVVLLTPCTIVTALKLQKDDPEPAPAYPGAPLKDDYFHNNFSPQESKPDIGEYNTIGAEDKHRIGDLSPIDTNHFPGKYGGIPKWATSPPSVSSDYRGPQPASYVPAPERPVETYDIKDLKNVDEAQSESGISAFFRSFTNLIAGLFSGIGTIVGSLFEVLTLPFSPLFSLFKEVSGINAHEAAEAKAAADAKAAAEVAEKQKKYEEQIATEKKIDEENYKNPPLWRPPPGWAPPAPDTPEGPILDRPPPGYVPETPSGVVSSGIYPPYRDKVTEIAKERKRVADEEADKADSSASWQKLPAVGGGTLSDWIPTVDEGQLRPPKAWESFDFGD